MYSDIKKYILKNILEYFNNRSEQFETSDYEITEGCPFLSLKIFIKNGDTI